ncbi:UNVERIFIED_CONTAM: hypothetical protein H355_012867 [Colinus virginianus]|nr:hypothetical protein H355_012867 [Colinus virginianus]
MQKLDLGQKEGHWVMLQNIHLMPRWTLELEKKLDTFAAEGSHPNFRCFLSSDPCDYIPISILERSIKLINEPPQGLKANFKRAFAFFSRDDFDEKDQRIKATLFGLCFFHAVMLERKKFGSRGWNMSYPFSIGDLRDSALVLFNYIEAQNAVKVPWDDLKYIFGEIMYGGHIIDVRDRQLCNTYLDFFMQICHDILEEIQEWRFDIEEIGQSILDEEKGPYQHVFLQECECMNVLVTEMERSLMELELGFKGELTMSSGMEDLAENLLLDRIPPTWTKIQVESSCMINFYTAKPRLSRLAHRRRRSIPTPSARMQLPTAAEQRSNPKCESVVFTNAEEIFRTLNYVETYL